MTIELPELYFVSTGDVEIVRFDCSDHLDDESIASAAMVQVGTTDLTIASVTATTGDVAIRGRTITAGQAIQALVSGFVINTTYALKMTAITDGTPARTFSRIGKIVCK